MALALAGIAGNDIVQSIQSRIISSGQQAFQVLLAVGYVSRLLAVDEDCEENATTNRLLEKASETTTPLRLIIAGYSGEKILLPDDINKSHSLSNSLVTRN